MNTLRFFPFYLIATSSLVSIALATAAGQAVDTSTLRSRALTSAIDTVPPKSVIETPFTIQSGTLTLPGTLTIPAKYNHQIPVALIVAGSGPTDRNGNSAGPLRAQNNSNLYAILAWQLATAGIPSVRYDEGVLGDDLPQMDLSLIAIYDFIVDANAG